MNLRNKLAFFIALNSYVELITRGTSPLSLQKAVANSLSYVKAFGGTEQRNLPKGYTELEYIVFNSTQIIDTGFTPNNNSRIESKCYRTGTDCWFYGASPSNPRVTLYHSSTGTSRWGYQSRSNAGFVADTEYIIVEDKNGLNINGVDNPWTSGAADDFTCDRSLTIGNNNGSTGTRYFAGNLYYMKIYDNDVLVRNFVPCQNASNVVGLYDTVNGVFYTDTGLVAGPEAVPTPDTPMDIVSNNGVLRIYPDIHDTSTDTLGSYLDTNNAVVTNTTFGYTDYIAVVPGNAYDFGVRSASEKYILTYDENKNYLGYTNSPGVAFTYTPASGVAYIRCNYERSYQNFAIRQQGIYTDGTVETVGMRTENLVDNTFPGVNINAEGEIKASAESFMTHTAPVTPGETYTCNELATLAYYTSKPNIGSVSYNNSRTVTTNPTFTVPNDPTIKYVAFRNSIADSWIVKGSTKYSGGTATTEMLLKVGDYQDNQSIIDGVVTRNVGVKVFDGTENWSAHGSLAGWFQLPEPLVYGGVAPALCTHYPYRSSQGGAGVYFSTGRVNPQTQRIIIADNVNFPRTGMLAEFKQFLANQYAAGTPVIVIYPLEEPTTESVAGQTLQVMDGDNMLEITQASLSGLKLEAKYKKRK